MLFTFHFSLSAPPATKENPVNAFYRWPRFVVDKAAADGVPLLSMSGAQHNNFLSMQRGWREPLTPGLDNPYNKERSIRQSVNPSIRQSVNPSIRQSVNPSIRQSVNPSIRQSVNPSIKRSSALRALSVFRSSLSLPGLGSLRSLLCFKFSALTAPLRRCCSALILAALSAAVAGAQTAAIGWTIETVAGGANFGGDGAAATAARLRSPQGVALDGSGNLYIADLGNRRIRKVDSTGNISTVAGTGTVGFSGDGGAATAAQLYPQGVALDGSGNLYIADGNNRIRKVDSSGNITTVAGTGTRGFSGDGAAAGAAQLNSPRGVALDGSGNLYIADTSNHRIRKIATVPGFSAGILSSGVITTVAGTGTSGFSGDGAAATAAQLNRPWGVALDGSGNLYIADSSNHRIRKVDASTGNITTVAGTGTQGSSGDGAAATAARLDEPRGVAVDGSGNLHIADTSNRRIRKVTASTGFISTVAGTTQGFGGDGGSATAAQLLQPQGVALDGSGNLYIADSFSNRIRKVDSSGNISTVAGGASGDGGAAVAAQLNFPDGVAPDGSGNLYIADTFNNRIRKVDSSGNISTVAGTGTSGFSGDGGAAGAAQLNQPQGVALDGSGNLYFADSNNNRIRKIATVPGFSAGILSSGVITTVAGTGTSGFSGDGGAATAAQLGAPRSVALDGAGNLYIADWSDNRIRKVDSSGNISTVAGTGTSGFSGDGAAATAAQLNWPRGVAPDGSGNLYIADTFNHRIRKVNSSGIITTVAGTGTRGFSGDGGAAGAAQLNRPYGVAVDGSGNLYIADSQNHRIRKVDSAGVISTVAQGLFSRSVALDGSGNLYIAAGDNRIYKLSPQSGGGVTLPTVSLSANPSVIRRGESATLTWSATNAVSAAIDQGIGAVALGGSRQVSPTATTRYAITVTNSNSRTARAAVTVTVREPRTPVNTVGGEGTAGFSGDGGPAAQARINSPGGVALDGSGNLYIADTDNHRIRKIDVLGTISTVAGTGTAGFSGDAAAAAAAQLNSPRGLDADEAGNLYIADTSNHRIRKIDVSTGNISTVAGTGTAGYGGDGAAATAAQLNFPRDVDVDRAGNLYIADTNNHRIRRVDVSTGNISTVVGTGVAGDGGTGGLATAGQLNYPYDVWVTGSGALYIADTFNNCVRWVGVPAGTGFATAFATGFAAAGKAGAAAGKAKSELPGRAQDPPSAPVLLTVAGTGTAGFSGDGGAATTALLDRPTSVALDGAGNLYIADTNNNRIRRVSAAGMIATVAGSGAADDGGEGGEATATPLNAPAGILVDREGNLYIADTDNHRIRRVAAPPAPPVAPPVGGTEAAVRARTFELAFVLRQDDAPAAQEVVLYAENGAVDFRAQPAQRWLSVEPASGRLRENEETVVTVTVDPAGLGVGRREGHLYVRSGGRLTARVRIALTVQPAAGPAVSEHGVVNAAVLSAFGERGLFGPRLLPVAPGSLVVVRGVNFTGGEAYAAQGFPLPTSLGGVRVLFDGLEAPLFAVGPQRIEAQAPALLGREALEAGGTALATVVVETAEGGSYPRRFWVAAHAPGVFTVSGAGTGQAAAVLAGAGALAAPRGAVGESRPARAGDVLQIYATGLGSVEPPVADGENSCAPEGVCLADGSNVVLRRTVERPRVSIGGVEVAADGVLFSGLAPALAAVHVVVVEVPAGIEPSAAAEVIMAIGGRASQAGVTVAVE